MSDIVRICSTCFFTEEFPGIVIDENGSCNFCSSTAFETRIKNRTKFNLDNLVKIVESIKSKKKGKYDCIIGCSGGLDSSYVLFVAKKLLKLNPLAIKFDHGFNYKLAAENLKTICKNLEVDLITIKSKQKNDFNYIKNMVLGLKDMDIYWGVCSFCHYILPTVVYKYALKDKITTILCSSNLYEGNLYLDKKAKIKYIIKRLKKLNPVQFIKAIFHIAVAQYYLLKLKLEFYLPPVTNIFKRCPVVPKGLQYLNITDYVLWDINEMLRQMNEEIGWKIPAKPLLPMRFDCKIEEGLINRTFNKACGITVHGIICNNLLYTKVKTKDELKDTVDHYNREIDLRVQEIFETLVR